MANRRGGLKRERFGVRLGDAKRTPQNLNPKARGFTSATPLSKTQRRLVPLPRPLRRGIFPSLQGVNKRFRSRTPPKRPTNPHDPNSKDPFLRAGIGLGTNKTKIFKRAGIDMS